MPHRFHFAGARTRIVLGAGASNEIGSEVARLGARRALVVATPTRRAAAERLSDLIGARSAGVLDLAREHVPLETAVLARQEAARRRADALVALGGGSSTGLAKAIALEHPLPIVAVPTTYSGSEMTPIWGLTERGVKRTGREERVRAETVVYDPLLLMDLPAAVGVPSAWNALAHAVEALYARGAGEETTSIAACAARSIAESLPLLSGKPEVTSRTRALFGACLAGACLGRASMGLHHQLCHVLGGAFGLPHARTHAALLPHVARWNLDAAPRARDDLARALGTTDPASTLFELAARTGVTTRLSDLGLSREALARVVDEILGRPYPNPRVVSKDALVKLLDDAYGGA